MEGVENDDPRDSDISGDFGRLFDGIRAIGHPRRAGGLSARFRKFCHKIKMADGNAAFLECLKANRDKLSKPCRAALESNSQ